MNPINPVKIRPATIDDIPQILSIEISTKEAPHWSAVEYWTMLQAHDELHKRFMCVALNGAEVVGFAVMATLLDEAEIESVAVRQMWRQRGHGRSLLEASVRAAREAGVKQIRLEVRRSNLSAQEFYTRLGFTAIGLRRDYYSRPVEDAILMSLKLTDAPHRNA